MTLLGVEPNDLGHARHEGRRADRTLEHLALRRNGRELTVDQSIRDRLEGDFRGCTAQVHRPFVAVRVRVVGRLQQLLLNDLPTAHEAHVSEDVLVGEAVRGGRREAEEDPHLLTRGHEVVRVGDGTLEDEGLLGRESRDRHEAHRSVRDDEVVVAGLREGRHHELELAHVLDRDVVRGDLEGVPVQEQADRRDALDEARPEHGDREATLTDALRGADRRGAGQRAAHRRIRHLAEGQRRTESEAAAVRVHDRQRQQAAEAVGVGDGNLQLRGGHSDD